MAKVSIFGSLTNIQMLIFTALRGTRVGQDDAGNRYYRGKPRRGQKRERRWVIYAEGHEASTVPAQWHGWLHHQTDLLPADAARYRKPWQKPHKANMTGSDQAYLPPGHLQKGGHRSEASADYVAWQPPG